MSSHESNDIHAEGEHHEGMSRGRIVKVFFILLGITLIEFFIALYLVPKGIVPIHYANPIYIVLTLLKAFYIVAFFMHLKFEKVSMIYTIVIPVLFIIGLILVLTNESHHWVDVWTNGKL